MKSSKKKLMLLICSVLLFALNSYLIILSFAQLSTTTINQNHLVQLSLQLFCCVIPMLMAWLSTITWMAVCIAAFASVVAFLVTAKTSNLAFLLFSVLFASVLIVLYFQKRTTKDLLVLNELEIERTVEEKNILEKEYEGKNRALEIFLHKYADYSNLRNVIEEFSSSLVLEKICDVIVRGTLNTIGKGELVLLYLVDLSESSLSLCSSKSIDRKRRTKIKKGDIFDQWVLKNKQQLMVNDISSDVRFDVQQTLVGDELKSLMIAPLVYQSRVVGTLRINAETVETFSIEDFRVFSIVAGLASAALSNAYLYQKTEELAIKDSLTGLYVHRYFKERLKEEYKRALLTNTSLTLIMADLDNFKSYNDRYGHTAGDIILKNVSRIIDETVKESGIVSRYGGEEFALLLPKCTIEQASECAEMIRSLIEKEVFDLRGINTGITISLGIANIPADTLDSEELIKVADSRLYTAKRTGKNQVVTEDVKSDE